MKTYAMYARRKKEGATSCNVGTRVWRGRWLERKFTSAHPEIGIKK
jgi:hypothetical protein